jgi:UDP-glucuronate 4-epimerase
MSTIMVTGAAGFIGAHVAAALADDGHTVLGMDNFNGYYAPELKRGRIEHLLAPRDIRCVEADLAEIGTAARLLGDRGSVDVVVHLAGQAGVRHSTRDPLAHVQANVVAFVDLLEASRRAGVGHVLHASSSSVYGSRSQTPFAESDRTDRPVSIYAATKQAAEAIAHATTSLHGLPTTGLRFFTVYGPWGRPDMAYFSFAQKIRRGEPIELFAGGELLRDFTYIADTVEAVRRLVQRGPQPGDAEVFNVGQRRPVRVLEFVRTIEQALGRTAEIRFAPMQPGDVPITCADSSKLEAAIGSWQWTSLRDGLGRFAEWLERWDPLPAPAPAPRDGVA